MKQSIQHAAGETQRFFQKVYGWMFLGLLITAYTAYYVSGTPKIAEFILGSNFVFYGLLIFELILVWGMVAVIKKISAHIAILMFLLYSLVTGLTLSVIFFVFTIQSIGVTFLVTAGMFGVMSVYGYVTKTDLSRWGNLLFMGLVGIILASIGNWFLQNSILDFVISVVGVIVFTGLTAYDVQKIKKNNILGNEGTDEDTKEAILGALELYLDFINLFLRLLDFFGDRK